jgi:predicted enzyme related to lactoylglutathione lyase
MTETLPTVGTVVIDCEDVDRLVDFWSQILGLEEKRRFPGFVWLSRMTPGGQSLAFQQVPEKKTVKNRVHLDMGHPDPEAFITRVESLGGRRVEDHEIMGFHWSVLADPEGNEFCVAKGE